MPSLGNYFSWFVFLYLLWIRPEYRFLAFFVIANWLLGFVFFDFWRLTWSDAPIYALQVAIGLAITFITGGALVAFRKWQKNRITPRERELDAEMKQIRAEIAAREGGRE